MIRQVSKLSENPDNKRNQGADKQHRCYREEKFEAGFIDNDITRQMAERQLAQPRPEQPGKYNKRSCKK